MIESDVQYESPDAGMTLIGRIKKGYSRFDRENSFGSGAHTIGKNMGPYLRFEGLRDRDRKVPQSERSQFMERVFKAAHSGNLHFLETEVYLPYKDIDLNYQNWRIEYTGSGAIKTRCTGKTIVQKQTKKSYAAKRKGQTVERFITRLTDVYETCPFTDTECPNCCYSRKLLVIPRCFYDDRNASFWGVVALESKSKHDGRLISVLNRELERLRSLFHFFPADQIDVRSVPLVQNFLPLSRETANFIPWVLRRTETHIQKPVIEKDGNDSGKRFGDTEWLLDMEIAPWWFHLMQERVDALKRQSLQGGMVDDAWRWIPPGQTAIALPSTKVSSDIATDIIPNILSREDISPPSETEITAEIVSNSYRNRLRNLCKQLRVKQNQLEIVHESLYSLEIDTSTDIKDEVQFQKVVDLILIKWACLQSSGDETTPDGKPIPLFFSDNEARQLYVDSALQLLSDESEKASKWKSSILEHRCIHQS